MKNKLETPTESTPSILPKPLGSGVLLTPSAPWFSILHIKQSKSIITFAFGGGTYYVFMLGDGLTCAGRVVPLE